MKKRGPTEIGKITKDPEILAGKPTIRGTRISVEFILELLASGMNNREILKEYPHLEEDDIHAAVDYAVTLLRKEEPVPANS